MQPVYDLSLIVLGAPNAGKTSVANKYAKNYFTEKKMTTIGVDFVTKRVILKENEVSVKIFDPAGQEKFRAYTPQYFKRVEGIIIIFSLEDRDSFQTISDYWIPSLEQYIDINQIPIVLFANKCDKPNKQVTQEEIKQLAKKLNIISYETSAKEGTNIEEAFGEIINQAYEFKQNKYIQCEQDIKKSLLQTIPEKKRLRKRDKCCK